MTTLCIDELSRALKRRWGWPSSASYVPADSDSPLLMVSWPHGGTTNGRSAHAVVPKWLEPRSGFDRPPGIPSLHGKAWPSMG